MRIDDRNHGSKKVGASGNSQTSLAITDLDDTDQLYRRLTINEVPDDVLLEIFNIYMNIVFNMIHAVIAGPPSVMAVGDKSDQIVRYPV